jgi:DeoR/GlpR family transcriptional regulator of sugar metabolism
MLKEERQRLILDRIRRDQKVNLVELSQQITVSYDSIRRDVIELEDKGLLKKVHGGAVSNSYLPFQTAQGLGVSSDEFTQLIRKAHRLFENNRIILMDGGITNFHLAESLPKNTEITIITNSLPLTTVLNEHPKVEVILLGGTYHKRYQIALGNDTMKQLEYFRPDLYIMGINGINPEAGLTLRHYEESIMKQKMLQMARRVAVCAIEEKLNHIENYKVCDLHEIDTLVTSLKPTDTRLQAFRKNGLELI